MHALQANIHAACIAGYFMRINHFKLNELVSKAIAMSG